MLLRRYLSSMSKENLCNLSTRIGIKSLFEYNMDLEFSILWVVQERTCKVQ